MKFPVIDAHIHLDKYSKKEQKYMLQHMKKEKIEALVTVSENLASSMTNLALSEKMENIFPAFGFHPEQMIADVGEMDRLFHFIDQNKQKMTAVGEVGLPYYLKKENESLSLDPYIEILEQFIKKAKQLQKPIVLHAVYEHAPIVCDMLERYSIQQAHFHWFKGDAGTIQRMIDNQYFISITPDILYKRRTAELVRMYPITQMMVETDGPWPYEGPFQNQSTYPNMIHPVIHKIAEIKRMHVQEVYEIIYANTVEFYQLSNAFT